ncbi:hypothetical protein ACFL20_00900 [Spirochaetota bacterium]
MSQDAFNKNDIFYPVILVFLCFIVLATNLLMDLPFKTLVMFLTGSLIYILFLNYSNLSSMYDCDYVQTWEASLAILTIIITVRFITSNIFIVFLAVTFLLSLADIFFKMIIKQKTGEVALVGFYVHIISTIIILYLLYNDRNFNAILITQALSGYYHSLIMNYTHLSILTGVAAFLFVIYLVFRPELFLFSHGPFYYGLSGINYKISRIAISIMKNLLLSISILFLGLLGGIGYYFFFRKNDFASKLESALLIILYTQVLLALTVFMDKLLVVFISVILTYATFYIRNNKRIIIYDRN